MSRRYTQGTMEFFYGLSHYLIVTIYDVCFRGEVAGLENIPKTGPFIIAANHASLLDPPIIGSQVPRQMRFFARKTLWKNSFARWWLDGVGTIPVDRDGGAIKRVLKALQNDKVLILFPEGTRSPDGALQPAKPGVGLIACRTQVPVLPARIFGSFDAWGKSQPLNLHTPVAVSFGAPLFPAEYDDPAAGKDRYQRASEKIMAAIAELQTPPETVV